jgi:hypothetical protein
MFRGIRSPPRLRRIGPCVKVSRLSAFCCRQSSRVATERTDPLSFQNETRDQGRPASPGPGNPAIPAIGRESEKRIAIRDDQTESTPSR